MSIDGYCTFLQRLAPDDRYDQLKRLNGSDTFVAAWRLIPEHLREEFFWFEKRADLESILQHEVTPQTIQRLIQKGTTCLRSLVQQYSDGDEYWYYHAFPGDTGYALVRENQIIAYCTLEITTATFAQQ